MKLKSEIKLIDYLIVNSGCDLCGKCIYYTPPKKDEDFTACKQYEKSGDIACRNGMIEFFKNKE